MPGSMPESMPIQWNSKISDIPTFAVDAIVSQYCEYLFDSISDYLIPPRSHALDSHFSRAFISVLPKNVDRGSANRGTRARVSPTRKREKRKNSCRGRKNQCVVAPEKTNAPGTVGGVSSRDASFGRHDSRGSSKRTPAHIGPTIKQANVCQGHT